MKCAALLCHEVTECGSLFCVPHRESGESLYAPDMSDERFFDSLCISILPDDVKPWMILKYVVLFRQYNLENWGSQNYKRFFDDVESGLKLHKSLKKLVEILKTNPDKFGTWTTNSVIEELESHLNQSEEK